MTTVENAAPRINFGPVPKNVRSWSVHERRYVRSLIMAAIHSPGIGKRHENREPIRRALSIHVASKMAKAAHKLSRRDDALYRRLCRLILERLDSIIEAPNARQIANEFTLYPNESSHQTFMKGLYATGRIVEVMYRLHITSKKRIKPGSTTARKVIKTWLTNDNWHTADTRDAWRKFRSIAHLAGAWTILFPPKKGGDFTPKDLKKLRNQLPQFLSNAEALRNFLVKPPEGKKRPLLAARDCRPISKLEGLPPSSIPWAPFSPNEEAEILKKIHLSWRTYS